VQVIPGSYLSEARQTGDPATVMVYDSTLGIVLNKSAGRNLVQLQTESLSRIFASETAVKKIAEDTEND